MRTHRGSILALAAILATAGCGGGASQVGGIVPPQPPGGAQVIDAATGPDGNAVIDLSVADVRLDVSVRNEAGAPLPGINLRAVADQNWVVLMAWDPRNGHFPEIWAARVPEVRATAVLVPVAIVLTAVGVVLAIREFVVDPPDTFLEVGGGRTCRGISGDLSDLLSVISFADAGVHALRGAGVPVAPWIGIAFTTANAAEVVDALTGYFDRNMTVTVCYNTLLVIGGRPFYLEFNPTSLLYASSGVGSGSGPSDLYVVSRYERGRDLRIDRLRTAAGQTPPVTDLARHPDERLFAISFDTLYEVNPGTAILTSSRPLSFFGANSAAFDPSGNLYVGSVEGRLYRVSLSTGMGTFVMQLPDGLGFHGDLAFESSNVFVAATNQSFSRDSILVRGNVATGSAARVGEIGFREVWGMGLFGGVLYGASASPETGRGVLLTIDKTSGRGSSVRDLEFSAFGATRR